MSLTTAATPSRPTRPVGDPAAAPGAAPSTIPVWRLNVLRLGYLVMAAGLAVTTWPSVPGAASRGLAEGTVIAMLVAMSVLALVGLRHPVRMLPLLLFEVCWKLLWLAAVALPLWLDDALDAATREQTAAVLWVVIILAVVPWRAALAQYVTAPGEPVLRRR